MDYVDDGYGCIEVKRYCCEYGDKWYISPHRYEALSKEFEQEFGHKPLKEPVYWEYGC